MKNYKEVADEVFQRSDKIIASDRKRKQNIIKISAAASVFCLAAVIGAGVWRKGARPYNTFDGYKTIAMNASWTYHYGSIKELCEADSLDLIARVKIGDGRQEDKNGFMMTVFTAKVEELIYGSCEDSVEIIMTGGVDHDAEIIYEISDDPLMQKGDEYIIFARKNESGTYTVLGGPQGRFVIDGGNVYPLYEWSDRFDAERSHIAGKSIENFVEEIRSYI